MASKLELAAQAHELAAELEITVEANGENGGDSHDTLTALVADLKAKKADAENVTSADDAPEAPAADAGEEFEEVPEHAVAKGKAITSMRGILGAGEEIKAEYLSGGADALAALVKAGHVVSNK